MDCHLEYGLRLHTEPRYKSLYRWAINEVEADGHPIDRDQIPWAWTLLFSATSCSLTNSFDVETSEPAPRTTSRQVIQMALRPGMWRDGKFVKNVTFSMFGTKRAIQNITLEVHALDDATKAECCTAWGIVSYTAEIDFRNETTDDCIGFVLHVKPETFSRYIAVIDRGAIDTVIFSAGGVDGFYSDWSPSISTNNVKVLVNCDDQKIDLPPDFQGSPPRLGRVHEARLLLHRTLELGKGSPSPSEIDDEPEPTPPAPSALQVTSAIDPRLLPALASLKQAAWVAVALLAAIAVLIFQKH